MDERGKVLIVGGDGLVGRALGEHLSLAGCDVVTTTRRAHEATIPKRVLLDLEQEPSSWVFPDSIDIAFITAAYSGFEACRTHPELSYRVNVSHTAALAQQLHARGAMIVFLSSSAVFDGLTPSPSEDTARSPTSMYGKQKALAEQQLQGLTPNLAIVRFGKAIPKPYPRFMTWCKQLLAGVPIRVLEDLRFAPTTTSFLVQALARIYELKVPGIFHLSPDEDVSYAEVATYICEKYRLDPALVIKQSTRESEIKIEYVPRFAALGCSQTLKALSLTMPKAWESVEYGLPEKLGPL